MAWSFWSSQWVKNIICLETLILVNLVCLEKYIDILPPQEILIQPNAFSTLFLWRSFSSSRWTRSIVLTCNVWVNDLVNWMLLIQWTTSVYSSFVQKVSYLLYFEPLTLFIGMKKGGYKRKMNISHHMIVTTITHGEVVDFSWVVEERVFMIHVKC